MPELIFLWFANSSTLATVAAILAGLAVALYLCNAVRLTVIDFRSHLLPNRILGPWFIATAVLLGAAALLAGEPGILLRMLLGAVILFAAYLVLHLIMPAGMGLGDVKLAAVLGLYLGFVSYAHLLWATALAFIIGALFSLVLLAARKATLRSAVAFGPFMLVGAGVALAVAG